MQVRSEGETTLSKAKTQQKSSDGQTRNEKQRRSKRLSGESKSKKLYVKGNDLKEEMNGWL